MRLVPFNYEQANHEYKNMYRQTGNGSIPIYTGTKTQTGYGLGSIFGSILKAAMPVVKQGVKTLGRTALKTGLNVAKDAIAGKRIGSAFSDNLNLAKDELLTKAVNYTGLRGYKKRKRASTSVTRTRPVKRSRRRGGRARKDIFN